MRLLRYAFLPVLLSASVQAQGYGGGTPSNGVVQTTVQHRYYEVQGLSEADLLHAMLQEGPEWEGRRFFGLTTSDVRYSYWKTPTDTGCDLADIVVTTAVTITLPRWQPPRGTPYALERKWRQFERALRYHEDGHRRLLEEEADQIRLALATLRRPTCDGMDAEAHAAVQRVRAGYGTRHRGYDGHTDHGRTQGAQWPLPQ
jgi:predicted secreted Zn-dependent protease